MIKSLFEKFTKWFLLKIVGRIKWKLLGGVTDADRAEIHKLLKTITSCLLGVETTSRPT